MARVFLNYRRQDSEGYVGRLYDHLTQHFKREDIFMDIDSIKPGDDFVEMLEDAVAACDVLIAVIGPQWLEITDGSGTRRLDEWNDFVRIEISNAIRRKKLIIPVLVGQARMPSPKDLPEDLTPLARRNAIELSHQRFAYDVEKLVSAIRDAIAVNSSSVRTTDPEVLRTKEAALKAVRMDLLNATDSPLYKYRNDNRSMPVLGEGYADANIMFIGEAPGKAEAESGKPFCGPSGDVLEEMLNSIELKREDVYLTNVLMDRAMQSDKGSEKREPTQQELAYYTPFVDRLIDIIQPGVIAPLGRFAMWYMLKKLDVPEKSQTITQLHGKLIKTQLPYGEVYVLPLYHPAVVLYAAAQKDILRKDFQKLKLFI